MARPERFELPAPWAETRRSSPLSYGRICEVERKYSVFWNMERMARPTEVESVTFCFVGKCSVQLSYGRMKLTAKNLYMELNFATISRHFGASNEKVHPLQNTNQQP